MQKMPLIKFDMSQLSRREVLVVTTCIGTGLAIGYYVGHRRKVLAAASASQDLSLMKQSMAQLSEDMVRLREAYEVGQLQLQQQELLNVPGGKQAGFARRREQRTGAPSVASTSSNVTSRGHAHMNGGFPRSASYVIDSDDSSVAYYSAAETESELEDFYDIMPTEGIAGYHFEPLAPRKGDRHYATNRMKTSGSGDSSSVQDGDIDDLNIQGVSASLRNAIRKIDMLMKAGSPSDFETAYEVVRECMENNAQNADEWKHPEFLWRVAQVYVRYGMVRLRNKPDERYECFKQAKQFALDARAGAPNNPECLKWVAISLGCCSKFADTRTKIQDGMEVKKVLDQALQYRPDDASLHHLKGRWCYEVSQLAWLERKVVQSVFGDAMSATVEEAKAHFEAVENVQPKTHKSNMLYLAKCILALDARDSTKKARDLLQAALIIPRSPADEDCDEEIQKVISTLR